MEELSHNSLALLLVLIPGFFSILIYNKLIYRERLDTFSKIVEALIYSVANYFGTALITGNFLVKGLVIKEINGEKNVSWAFDRWSIVVAIALSILLPIVVGWVTRYDILLISLRFLRITNRTGRESIWLDVFYDIKKYVIVHMKDGRRLYGWPLYFANKIDSGPLYLTRAAWIDENGQYIDTDLHGIFLIDADNIAHIEFLNEP